MDNPDRPLVLASSSQYRAELLARLSLAFETRSPGIDETPLPGESPPALVRRLAEAKARAVARGYAQALVLGCDQVADAAGIAVGKPGDHAGALAQLRSLSGRTVDFHTAVALVDAASGRCRLRVSVAATRFRELTAAAIEAYLQQEKPYDCAGSIKAEGLGIALVEWIRSDDPTALIGLPLIAVVDMLREEGIGVPASAHATLTATARAAAACKAP